MGDAFKRGSNGQSMSREQSGRAKQPANNRRHERYGMRFPVTLHFEDGEEVRGFSEDVSLSGFFVATGYSANMALDRLGKGTIHLGQDSYTFHCRISRLMPNGIGVTLNQDYAMLGLAITNHLFKELATVTLTK
ncbi:MAG: PilZ domain-containing protein [Magnetococcales bacterium]|nr:PilZ domain-containing protein [Magnetococcales bacterium]